MKLLAALPALALLSACAMTPPLVVEAVAATASTLVSLGQPLSLGELVVTPMQVVEDNRCPENARCIQAGQLVVEARIDGPGWRETVPLTLGEQHLTHGNVIAFTSGIPERQANRETPGAAYRLGFELIRQLSVAGRGERVQVDGPAVTPVEVLEDSRCPADVQCVWAGRLRLRTTIHLGAGDRTRELVLGEPVPVADGLLELAGAWVEPATGAGVAITPADYRFAFRFDGGL
jgi:hypothetical protein